MDWAFFGIRIFRCIRDSFIANQWFIIIPVVASLTQASMFSVWFRSRDRNNSYVGCSDTSLVRKFEWSPDASSRSLHQFESKCLAGSCASLGQRSPTIYQWISLSMREKLTTPLSFLVSTSFAASVHNFAKEHKSLRLNMRGEKRDRKEQTQKRR